MIPAHGRYFVIILAYRTLALQSFLSGWLFLVGDIGNNEALQIDEEHHIESSRIIVKRSATNTLVIVRILK